ncbi:MAG: gamma-glutamyltransferase [Clostridia bacterium]|nr:gamma-glutamyltransferase [Clostridia bacterium]
MSKKEISRRSFLKGTAAAGASLAAASLLPRISMAEGEGTEFKWETGVTSIGDWQLWDPATGELNLEGRGANGENAVVSAGTPWAAQAGLEVLKKGGNAVDAAAAVAFAISVTEPQASGIGGGGFMTMRAADGTINFINFRECAPELCDQSFWPVVQDPETKRYTVVGGANSKGGRAIGVPGTVAGMAYAVEKFGKLTLADAVQPAIDLCENGFYIGPTTGVSLDSAYTNMVAYPEFASIYTLPEEAQDELGRFTYFTGDLFKNTQQAKALKLIQEQGRDGFYKGELQDAMIKVSNKYGGVFQPKDFEEYEADLREPVRGTFMGKTVISSPLPSSGGTCIIQLLNVLENFDLKAMGHNSVEYIHVLSEAMKLVYADRSKYLAANTEDALVQALMTKEYGKYLASLIKMDSCLTPEAHDPFNYEHQDTTSFAVADKEGNIVCVTFTINGYFGSYVAPDGYGFLLNNEMADYDSNPESPNAIGKAKYPLSSMSPTIVLNEDGSPFLAVGSPGGATIIVAVLQIILDTVVFGMDMQEAVNQPRIADNASANLRYETRIPQETIDALVALGHKVTPYSGDWDRSSGSTQGVLYTADGLHGGADPRRDNKAVAF